MDSATRGWGLLFGVGSTHVFTYLMDMDQTSRMNTCNRVTQKYISSDLPVLGTKLAGCIQVTTLHRITMYNY